MTKDEQETKRDGETKKPSKVHGLHSRVWHASVGSFGIPACGRAGMLTCERGAVTCPDCLSYIANRGWDK